VVPKSEPSCGTLWYQPVCLSVVVVFSPYMIGTMRQTTSNSDLQLTHHNFRWVLFTVHAEPVRGLLSRLLRRRHRSALVVHREGSGGQVEGQESAEEDMERIISWLPRTWSHVNRFLEARCSADVTIGKRFFLVRFASLLSWLHSVELIIQSGSLAVSVSVC